MSTYKLVVTGDDAHDIPSDTTGALVDEVSYTDHLPWPPAADGTGRTPELIDASQDNSDPNAWGASSAPFGTPGSANSLSP